MILSDTKMSDTVHDSSMNDITTKKYLGEKAKIKRRVDQRLYIFT